MINGHEPIDAKPSAFPNCPLTQYQLAVLQWTANGKRDYDIASIMGNTTEGAINAHVCRIMDILGAASRTSAVAMALRAGWIK